MQQVNGQEYQHALVDVDVALSGGASAAFPGGLTTFQKISYEDGAPKNAVKNKQGQNIGFTIKDQETSGSVSMLLSEWFRLKEWIVAQRPTLGIGQIKFDLTVQYGNSLTTIKTDKIEVMFDKEPKSSENNQDALMIEIPLFVFKVIPHGGSFIKYDPTTF